LWRRAKPSPTPCVSLASLPECFLSLSLPKSHSTKSRTPTPTLHNTPKAPQKSTSIPPPCPSPRRTEYVAAFLHARAALANNVPRLTQNRFSVSTRPPTRQALARPSRPTVCQSRPPSPPPSCVLPRLRPYTSQRVANSRLCSARTAAARSSTRTKSSSSPTP
jgi:hypothetical protein